MNRALIGFASLTFLTCAAVAAQQQERSSTAEELLGKGLHQEQVEGDCASAIKSYKQVPVHTAPGTDTGARALLQLAGCYEKLQRHADAAATYQQILRSVPLSSPTYSIARSRLAPTQRPAAVADPLAGQVIDSYFENASRITASPSGRMVAYTKSKPGRSTLLLGERTDIPMLFVRDLSSGQERLLVDPHDRTELITRILWAPDESAIAFTVRLLEVDASRPAAAFYGWLWDLRVVTLATGATVSVSASQASQFRLAQWSGDSRFLALDRRNADFSRSAEEQGPLTISIWDRSTMKLTDIATSLQASPAAAPVGLAWSPDAKRIAYFDVDSGGKKLSLISLGGEAVSEVTLPPPPQRATVRLGGWHVNGDLIVVHNRPGVGNDFYMVPTNGQPYRKVCEGRGVSGGDGCQAPDTVNRFLVARRNSEGGRAFLRDLHAGKDQALTDASVLEQPILLPTKDSKLIAFRSDRDGDYGVYLAAVDTLPVRNPVRIATLDSPTSTASGFWTPDGLVLTLSRTNSNIYRVDVDPKTGKPTSAPRRLTHNTTNNQGASPAPDATQIAYRVRDRQTGIALMDANGANERLLTSVPPDLLNSVGTIGWKTPTELLLQGGRVTGSANLFTLNITTGSRSPVSSSDIQAAGLRYVPGTNELFYWNLRRYSEGSAGEIWARSLATGADRFVYKTAAHSQFFEVSSDGSRLFYSSANDAVTDGKPVPAEIRMVDLESATERVLLTFPNSQGAWNVTATATWGHFLLYQDPEKSQRILDLETGDSWPLFTEELRGIEVGLLQGKWAPDGTYVLFTGLTQRTEHRQWTGLTYGSVIKQIERR